MRKKLQNIVGAINRSIFVGERYERNMRSMARKDLIIICLCTVLLLVNLAQGDTSTVLACLLMGVASALSWYLNRVRGCRRGPVRIAVTAVILALTYMVIGRPNGFGYQWTLLAPLLVSYFMELKTGILITVYFQLLFILAFYTPLRINLAAHYPDIVMDRFPILFFFTGLFSLFIMYEYHKSVLMEIDYEGRLNAEVKRQTALAVQRGDKLERQSYQMVEALARTIDARDRYTNGHSFRVMQYAVELARKLGWEEAEIEELRREALLHDIGKIGIPDAVLNKPGKLTEAEYGIIQSHTSIGMNILFGMEDLAGAASVAGCHHERYDGRGYPSGLAGTEIPEHARIVAIADAYDAMHSNRIYRPSMSNTAILRELRKCRGIQFDPGFLDVFLALMNEGALDFVA